MNSKISLPELTALLALQTGKPKKVCEDFLKVFFSTVADALENGENVKIKGIGSFKVTKVEARKSVNVATGQEFEIPAHNRVSFVPSKELAVMVNVPFEAFDAVELSDAVTDDMLDSVSLAYSSDDEDDNVMPQSEIIPEQEDDVSQEDDSYVESIDSDSSEQSEYDLSGEEDSDICESEQVVESRQESSARPVQSDNGCMTTDNEDDDDEDDDILPSQDATAEEEPDSKSSVPESEKSKKHKFGWGFVSGFGVAVLLGIIVWLSVWIVSLNSEMADIKSQMANQVTTTSHTEDVAVRDTLSLKTSEARVDSTSGMMVGHTVEQTNRNEQDKKDEVAPTPPSDKPVYDRISKTRYLTTMAQEYYGNYDFWPYIYEANANLGHPDRIRPGTRIRVPSLSALGVNPNSKADIRKARNKGAAIYAKYKTPMQKPSVKKQ